MKKNSILICILMSLSLVGCNSSNFNFSNRVGEEDVIDFLKEKNMDDETYDSANFLIEINEEYESKSGSSSSKIEIKGRMIVDTNDGTAEMYYKANGTVKSTSYSADGKDTEKMSMEEEFTVVSTKNKYNYYIDNEVKYSSDYSSYSYKNKVKALNANKSIFGKYIDDVLDGEILDFDISSSSNSKSYYYIDGNDLAIVTSESSSHSVIIFHCNDDELENIEMSIETSESEIKIEYDFDDVDRISIPRDAEDYKDLT